MTKNNSTTNDNSKNRIRSELTFMTHRFWGALIFTVPLLIISMGRMIAPSFFGQIASPRFFTFAELLLTTPVCLWAALPFYTRAIKSLRGFQFNMFTLIGLGVSTAYGYSVVAVLFPQIFPSAFQGAHGGVRVYFEASGTIVSLIWLGQIIELRMQHRTGGAMRALLELAPHTAIRITHDVDEIVSIDVLQKGDMLRIVPGAKIPVDGVVIEGYSYIDESMITGEPMPAKKEIGSKVVGGTVNGTQSFIMRAEKIGSETLLSRIITTVKEAQQSRAPIQRLADTVSRYFVPAIMGIAILSFILWFLYGPEPRLAYAIINAVSVLIIACPCALGLATPMSIVVASGKGAQIGILFKNAASIEMLQSATALLVDKTGTLTEGKPRITKIHTFHPYTASHVLKMTAGVERSSEHPIAHAIVQEATQQNIAIPPAHNFSAIPGKGAHALVIQNTVYIGNATMMKEYKVSITHAEEETEALRKEGNTIVFVAIDKTLAGYISIADPIKQSSFEAMHMLHKENLSVIMLSGDNHSTATAVAKQLTIDTVLAGLLPHEKAEHVKTLKENGAIVVMAGDGINDAPALAHAHISIAMGTGTDVAMESADITLVKGDLRGIARARHISRATMKNIRTNLFFAFFYNILGVPIAAGILYPFTGMLLHPVFAAVAMSLSSISVIGNALRLRKLKA